MNGLESVRYVPYLFVLWAVAVKVDEGSSREGDEGSEVPTQVGHVTQVDHGNAERQTSSVSQAMFNTLDGSELVPTAPCRPLSMNMSIDLCKCL